ncbi:MAG: DUF424 family protein [Thermoproteota archaeon]|nr:DUF424 family protein [Thermoproteota archaeon]MDW0134132.1 DUF424 family protein [Nitrososphaeraceae archaeon]
MSNTERIQNKKTYVNISVSDYKLTPSSDNDTSRNLTSRYALRTIRYQNSLMVNVCDLSLIDKQIQHGDITIDIKKNYWMDKVADESEIESYLKKSSISNLAGKATVEKAIELNLAKRSSVKYFSDVPFLMIYRFRQSY